MLNTILLAFAAVLILRALRIKVIIARVPVPPEAPRGLYGWHATVIHVPPGVGFSQRAECRKVDKED